MRLFRHYTPKLNSHTRRELAFIYLLPREPSEQNLRLFIYGIQRPLFKARRGKRDIALLLSLSLSSAAIHGLQSPLVLWGSKHTHTYTVCSRMQRRKPQSIIKRRRSGVREGGWGAGGACGWRKATKD